MRLQERVFKINKVIFCYHTKGFADKVSSKLNNKSGVIHVQIEISKQSQTLAQMFSCQFSVVSRNTFFTEHLRAIASDYQELQKASTFRVLRLTFYISKKRVLRQNIHITGSQLNWLSMKTLPSNSALSYLKQSVISDSS